MINNHQKFAVFLICWLILNLITASFTELYSDEAYYWMYSQFLDWGYFDHPPGVALMIKMGEWLGEKNELAVRFVNVLLSTSSLYLMYRYTKPQDALLFAGVLFCFLVFHLTGFVSLPDGPLLFFSLLFLGAFHRLADRPANFINQLLVGCLAALMLYSKYHGGLVIILSVLSTPRLLKHYGLYVSGLIALLLLAPHILWQYENDFPSILYHLIDRAAPSYKIRYTTEYLLGNVPFLGGLVAIFLLIASFFYKGKGSWERILRWNLYGTFIFFLLISFKGQRIEANWTLPAAFPLIYLGYKQLEQSRHLSKFKVLVWIFVPIMLLLRVHVLQPWGEVRKDRAWDFHYKRVVAENIANKAGDRYIAANRYQDASLLNFYLEKDYIISSLNINSRSNQYSIWQFEADTCVAAMAFMNSHLEGLEVEQDKFGKVSLSLLDTVAFPSCINMSIHRVTLAGKQLEIVLNIDTELSNQMLGQFQVQSKVYGEMELLTESLEPLQLVQGLKQEYIMTVDRMSEAQQLEIRLFSDKLGGVNRQVVVYQLNDED